MAPSRCRHRKTKRSPHPWCGGAAFALAAVLLVCGHASGQIELQIVDGMGLGVPAARVEIYGTAELLHVISSDTDGVTTLPADRWEDARRISVTHLGFETLIVQSGDLRPGMTLRLAPEALTLEGLEVEVQGALCPLEESEEARALWRAVASRYSTDTGRRRLTASYLYGAGSVSETSLLHVSEAGLGRSSGSRVPRTPGAPVGLLETLVERQGYSWEPPRSRWGRRDLNRVYPSLEMWHAYHFATATFGARHSFAVVRDRPESIVLAFCPRSPGRGTGLMGTLELIPETRFVSASWRFIVDDPDEDAGGEVDFTDHRVGTRRLPHLLARRGIFFRHNGKRPPYPDLPRSYYREAVARVDWQVLPPGAR